MVQVIPYRHQGEVDDRWLTEFYQLGLDYVNYTDANEPTSYEEAIVSPDADTWLQDMQSELDSIKENNTWELVELPAKWKPLSCKWVYQYKYVFGSKRTKYKAWLIAKGFKQEHEVDYDEIFAPVVKMTILRLVLRVMATTTRCEDNFPPWRSR